MCYRICNNLDIFLVQRSNNLFSDERGMAALKLNYFLECADSLNENLYMIMHMCV